ncbi:hypothetical protein J7L67_00770 [bacterium]|nr:hypothetical protein [bacterium]
MPLVSEPNEINDVLRLIANLPKPVRLGFTGVPPAALWEQALCVSDEIIDLDMPLPAHRIAESENIMPKISCATLRTITANILLDKNLDWVILSSGIDKCDGARFLGIFFNKQLNIPVVLTENLNMIRQGNPICESGLALKEKMEFIVDDLTKISPPHRKIVYRKPICGFWGVPPNDFDVLDLFPAQTHIFGWTRCMENRTPADHDLEMFVNPHIPIVFFAQAFCPKNVMAYGLAKKYNGLYVEVNSKVDHSVKAKIEAFLWLSLKRDQK